MADGSGIEWTDATWNPITGCSVKSPGCKNCYAMREASARLRNHPSRVGLTEVVNGHHVWNGQVRFNEEWLDQPLRWRRPRLIFVCAHGDLFHEGVLDEWIDRVFAVMALAPQHIFQVLTKRSDRMRAYLVRREWGGDPTAERPTMPLQNLWIGVSAEDQRRANERLSDLRATPAAVRWISAEPLLGPIAVDLSGIDWVVAGGESGPRARPMHPDWARSLRDQCAAAGVPFHFKQWGEWEAGDGDTHHGQQFYRVGKKAAGRLLDGVEHNGMPR